MYSSNAYIKSLRKYLDIFKNSFYTNIKDIIYLNRILESYEDLKKQFHIVFRFKLKNNVQNSKKNFIFCHIFLLG